MTWQIIISLGLAVMGAVLYRIGGSDLHLANKTKYRDAGTSLCAILMLMILNPQLILSSWLGLLLSFGLSWGVMTTYFKKKGEDAKWYNWIIVGFAFGIAFLPYALETGLWLPLLYRTIITTIFVTMWSEAIGNATLEELGRGFIFCISVFFFISRG